MLRNFTNKILLLAILSQSARCVAVSHHLSGFALLLRRMRLAMLASIVDVCCENEQII